MKSVKISIIVFIVVLLLVGCRDEKMENAEEQVSIFLDRYKQKDNAVSELLLGVAETDYMNFEGISSYFAEELNYKIKSCNREEENLYKVEVEIQTINFEQLLLDSYQETVEKYGEEKIADFFVEKMEQNIKEKEYEYIKIVCNVVVRELNDEFKIEMNSSFANALTGGMNEYLDRLQGGK